MNTIPTDVHLRVVHRPATKLPDERLLSPDERRRFDSFRSAQRRGCFVMGRTTLRTLLAERLQIDPRDVSLQPAPDGAIDIGEPGVYASLGHTVTSSPHSEIVTAAAVGSRPVGVDVEAFKPRREDLYERILDPSEYHLLKELGESHQRAQVIVWALKEAALKANRTGLRQAMRSVSLKVDPERQRAVCTLQNGRKLESRFEVRDDFVVALVFSPM